ncbi:MAG: hypothetical protein HZA48_12630 [Planctomycetes bacterium]|nr:hypothetical protein [Planctomycetota bacterium]
MKKCYKCGTEWEGQTSPGTKAVCDKCMEYLHSCRNCRYFDNKRFFCSNSLADRVFDTEKFNECDEFRFTET